MKYWQFGLAMLLLLGACTSATVAPPDPVVIIEPPAIEDQETTPEPTTAAPATTTEPAPAVASLNLPSATVISVGDGDTLRINDQGETITVRFACMDAV